MGIVNVTPDSFSDGGRFLDPSAALDHALQLAAQGADFLDVGGESTRPGAIPVDVVEELRRVVPVIERLAPQVSVPISVDTTKSEVARAALDAGATIVNDVSGLTFDPEMVRVCAESDCGVVVMHIQGTPQTMQMAPHYEDVVDEVAEWLCARVESLGRAGIDASRIVVDPGVGFGKTAEHNRELLSHVAGLRRAGRPVLVGHSRKRFLAKLLGRPLDELLAGTIGCAVALAEQQVEIVRVHDVGPVKDALRAWAAVRAASDEFPR